MLNPTSQKSTVKKTQLHTILGAQNSALSQVALSRYCQFWAISWDEFIGGMSPSGPNEHAELQMYLPQK